MRAIKFPSLFAAAVGFACLMSADARAGEKCKINTCVTMTPTKTGSGWKVHIKVRTSAPNYEFFNVIVPGQSQLEVDGPGNNAEFDFDAPGDWNGIVSAQACIDDRPIQTRCDKWATFSADFPKGASISDALGGVIKGGQEAAGKTAEPVPCPEGQFRYQGKCQVPPVLPGSRTGEGVLRSS